MKTNFITLIFIAVTSFHNVIAQQKTFVDLNKKVIFIAGTDSHGKGEHEYNGGVAILAQKLKEALPEMDTVVFRNGWPKDTATIRNAATIVIFCDGGEGQMVIPHLNELASLMNKGTGLVMIHYTLEFPAGEIGNAAKDVIGGYFEMNWSVNPMWTPKFTKLPDHPVANGVKPFSIRDEWYYHMRFTDNLENITPILQLLPGDSTLSRPDGTHSNNAFVREAVLKKKQPQTLAWAYERRGGGKAFGFTGGHVHANWKDNNFRMLVLNAIVWTAGLDVPKKGIQTVAPSLEQLEKLEKRAK